MRPRPKLPCPTREQVREAAACPRCDAPIGTECYGKTAGASRAKNHIERVKLAIAVLYPKVPG